MIFNRALVGHGDHDAAKKILIPLKDEVQEETVRQTSLINLLEMAAKERDKLAFERYRGELRDKLSLPELQVHYHLYLGKGYQAFWRPLAAMEERQIALSIATEHGLQHLRTLVLDDMHGPVAGGALKNGLASNLPCSSSANCVGYFCRCY